MKQTTWPVALKGDGIWHFPCPQCGHVTFVYGRVSRICEHGVSTTATWVCQHCKFGVPDEPLDYELHMFSHTTEEVL